MSRMKTSMDFIKWLGRDLSVKIFSFVDDPRDLIRVSAVCSSWGNFVIENGLCKQLCLKMVPEVSGVVFDIEVEHVIEPDSNNVERYYSDWEFLKRRHKVYARLAFGLTPMRNNCISKQIRVAYPYHLKGGIMNTLEPASETLLYGLCSEICLVTEIRVQKFKAYFDDGFLIYSAKAIRVRFGCPKHQMETTYEPVDLLTYEMLYDWTYTSPVFPMSQENKLQQFMLPQPVLCIGGIMLLELFERDHKQERSHHVEVVGRTISPAFVVTMLRRRGSCSLVYGPSDTGNKVVTAG